MSTMNEHKTLRDVALDERMPAVLVFRTTVNTRGQMLLLAPALSEILGHARWNFDLEDRDRVLRIEHGSSARDRVIDLLRRKGFMCAELV